MSKYRFQWYQKIYDAFAEIIRESEAYGKELGSDRLKRDIGLYAGSSARPGNLPDYVLDPIIEANRGGETPPVRVIEDELREVVKDVYGDEYDAAAANTCEACLRICFETLCAPPIMRQGDTYRGRILMPYSEDYERMGGYGRAFPPKYKNLLVDRTVSGGELGVEGKTLANLETLYVRMAGAKYESHGIRFNPTSLLTAVDADESVQLAAKVATRHADSLVGVSAVGYDTPSYGHGQLDDDGTPLFLNSNGGMRHNHLQHGQGGEGAGLGLNHREG